MTKPDLHLNLQSLYREWKGPDPVKQNPEDGTSADRASAAGAFVDYVRARNAFRYIHIDDWHDFLQEHFGMENWEVPDFYESYLSGPFMEGSAQ